MKKLVFIIGVVIFLVACGSGNQKYSEKGSNSLKTLIDSKHFEIISNSAQPRMTAAIQQLGNAGVFVNGSTAGNIDITTNTNYLRMKNDSVMAFLPYYGERQFGGGYNNASGIEFEGIPKDLQITQCKKDSYEIRFNIHDKNSNTDFYRVYIQLFPNLSSNININSSSRNNIQYRGTVKALKN